MKPKCPMCHSILSFVSARDGDYDRCYCLTCNHLFSVENEQGRRVRKMSDVGRKQKEKKA